jgi:dihydroorotate dehydrogenase
MVLRGIEFGTVLSTPGAFGFYGEGYWFHWPIELLGWSVKSMVTKAFKCVTAYPCDGNMPLDANFQPKEWFPRCIIVDPIRGHTLNAVAWSNPGIDAILGQGRWQQQTEPFVIQLGAVRPTQEERRDEYALLAYTLTEFLPSFRAPVAVQLVFGCPNVHHSGEAISAEEIKLTFDIFSIIDRPLIANLNPTAPNEWIKAAADHESCDALWLTNAIPWGTPGIDWKGIYGSNISPLSIRGFSSGSYSGPAAFHLNLECVMRTKKMMADDKILAKSIISGGAYFVRQVYQLQMAGISGLAAAGGTMRYQPWGTRRIVEYALRYIGQTA